MLSMSDLCLVCSHICDQLSLRDSQIYLTSSSIGILTLSGCVDRIKSTPRPMRLSFQRPGERGVAPLGTANLAANLAKRGPQPSSSSTTRDITVINKIPLD